MQQELDDLELTDAVLIEGDYPMMQCKVHTGVRRPGYLVCVHVANGADAAFHVAPTNVELGHIVCARCRADELSENSLRLTRVSMGLELHCADCVAYHLGDRLPAAEVEEPRAVVQ